MYNPNQDGPIDPSLIDPTTGQPYVGTGIGGPGYTPISFPPGAAYGGGSTQTPPLGTPPPGWTPQYVPGYTPPTTTSGTGTGGTTSTIGGSGVLAPFTQPFTAPSPVNLGGPAGIPFIPQTPTFTPPGYTPPPAFQLPTAAQAANDPGYQFSLGQGEQALQQSAAARGVLNSGGTLKDVLNYGQAAAGTQYQNVLNRDLQQYNTNYQTQYRDPYNIAFQNATASFAPQMLGYQTQAAAGQRANEDQFNNAFNVWLQNFAIHQGNVGNALTGASLN